MVIKTMRGVFLFALLTGCVADLVKTEPSDPALKTVGLMTGVAADDGLYKLDFERAARRTCGGEYAVVERSRQPTTLSGMELPQTNFYWVVRCKRAP